MTTDNTEKQQLTRYERLSPSMIGLPEGLINDAAQATKCLLEVSSQVNMLAPISQIPNIPEDYHLALVVIHFPTGGEWLTSTGGSHKQATKWDKLSNGTWYQTDNGKLGLHKAALRQLASAAGLSIETENLSKDANYWVIRAKATMRTLDGGKRSVTATKELDLRPNSTTIELWEAQAKRKNASGTAERRVQMARENGFRMAESKAVNAVIRDILCVQTAYTKEEAKRPFVYPKLTWIASSEEAKKMQAAMELGVIQEIYNQPPKRVVIEAEVVEDETKALSASEDEEEISKDLPRDPVKNSALDDAEDEWMD